MTERLKKIFDIIPKSNVFADIGCDHGYIAKAVLDSGKAEKVIVSDISEKCLKKAQTLLYTYIDLGKAESVVSDGFEKVGACDTALIAGMGGEEICSILDGAIQLPQRLILQPMKNCDKVRLKVIDIGYKILKDFVFRAGGKYYDLISLEKGKDVLTEEQIEFGRDNVLGDNPDFKQMIEEWIEKYKAYESALADGESKILLNKKIEKLKKYI